MDSLNNGKIFPKTLFPKNIFGKSVKPTKVEVSFVVADSVTGNAVTLSNILIDGRNAKFVQDNTNITIKVPIDKEFTIDIQADNYNTFSGTYTAETLMGAVINMVEIQEVGNMQISISWNHSESETNRDLDSYLYPFTDETMTVEAMNHVYHGYKDSENEHTHIQLVKDDTGSDTGETVNFIPFYKDYTYRFFIEDYTHRSQTAPSGYADWHAKITVTYQNKTVFESEAPADARGVYWDVFSLTNGVFTTINNFTDTKPIS